MSKLFLTLLAILLASSVTAFAQMTPEEAMARLHDRERTATTQPLQHEVDQLTTQNAALQKQVAALSAEVAQLRQQLAAAAASPSSAQPASAVIPSSSASPFDPLSASARTPATRPTISTDDSTGDRREYVGPRGGVYHYSASGRKVYEKR